MKYVIIGTLATLVILLLLYGIPNMDKKILDGDNDFDESNLIGIINYVGIKYHRDSFKLIGNDKEFVFSSHPIDSNKLSFSVIAQIGDSIIKKPSSDTLLLIKKRVTYKFLIDN